MDNLCTELAITNESNQVILVQSNQAAVDRDEGDEAERTINVAGIKHVVGVGGFFLTSRTCHIHLVHAYQRIHAVVSLSEQGTKHIVDLRSPYHQWDELFSDGFWAIVQSRIILKSSFLDS